MPTGWGENNNIQWVEDDTDQWKAFEPYPVSTAALVFTAHEVTFPLYGRMREPIITGSKPKVVCEGSGAYVLMNSRDAKSKISGN